MAGTKNAARAAQARERVTITLPRARHGEAEDLFVSINGVSYLIPKGKPCDVPPEVAEEVRRAQAADDFFHDEAERRMELGRASN